MVLIAIRKKMFNSAKFSILLFHFAFILIIIGAAITRFISFEGNLHLRENESKTKILNFKTRLLIEINNDSIMKRISIATQFNQLNNNNFKEEISFDNQQFDITLHDFIPKATETLVSETMGNPLLMVQYENGVNQKDFVIKFGETILLDEQKFSFNAYPVHDAFQFVIINDSLYITNHLPITYTNNSGKFNQIEAFTLHPTHEGEIYTLENQRISIKRYISKATTNISSGKSTNPAALIFEIENQQNTKKIIVYGDAGYTSTPKQVKLNNYDITISYGSPEVEMPFSLKLNDFVMKRYPGSSSPSAYESHVLLIDSAENYQKEYNIYMNNVLEYKGFRFFQTSFDNDELGTVLTVTHDFYGTYTTYLGYFLLTLGMFWSLFNKKSRFRHLFRQINAIGKGKTILLLLLLSFGLKSYAQNLPANLQVVDKNHAAQFGRILMQDNGGRIKPVNTLSHEFLRKLNGRSTYKGLSPEQVMMGLMLNPEIWATMPIIKIKHPELLKRFKNENQLVPISEMFSMQHGYVLTKDVDEAYAKGAGKQNQLEKDIIKLDERVNVLYAALNGDLLTIFPDSLSENHQWHSINDVVTDSAQMKKLFSDYNNALSEAIKTGNYETANLLLTDILHYQKQKGKAIYLSDSKIKAEMFYNESSIFRHLFELYFILGIAYLAYLIGITMWAQLNFPLVHKTVVSIVIMAFALQTFGLALRWYIAGHAPWSNGYESMIYIAWVSLLSGLLFSKQSKFALAGTTFLAGVVLLIAHLSWIDPEITNLVPVLNSYWLTIHVAVIIAGYGFLGLAAMLGLINLILYSVNKPELAEKINTQIKQLSYINELALILGLYLLTIGTFLGGVWANESWGRYWGWDPKETWALISMLIYTIVLHLRFLPKLNSLLIFNFLSLISFASVIMTYFGVNYYLAGLHSYASGDPVPIPASVIYISVAILVLSATAFYKNKRQNYEQMSRE